MSPMLQLDELLAQQDLLCAAIHEEQREIAHLEAILFGGDDGERRRLAA